MYLNSCFQNVYYEKIVANFHSDPPDRMYLLWYKGTKIAGICFCVGSFAPLQKEQ